MHSQSLGAPEFSQEWLEYETSRHESFKISDVWLAIDTQNTIVASLGLWDQSSIRKTVATKFTKSIRTAIRALALFGLIWRLPPIPIEGKPLSYLFGRWSAAATGESRALQSLCHFLMNGIRSEQKCQFVSIGFHESDHMNSALKGIVKVQERIEVYSHWIKENLEISLPGAVPQIRFVDLVLI